MGNKNTIIEFNNITLKYPEEKDPILKNLSFNIKKGDYLFLIGPNGSGKSTLFKLIMSKIKQNSGSLFLKDNLNIAYISQDIGNSLFIDLTISENLKLMNINLDSESKLQEYLSEFNENLTKFLDKPIKYLSGGERQALVLAIKLFNIPDLLLLDEHTSALDPKAEKILMSLSNKKILENNITTIICTHNLGLLKEYGKKVIIMHEGKIIPEDINKENFFNYYFTKF
ncbi:MAG: ATP-binding cassette domain-containing protein [Bacteroidetes bacterium]|nr:ATP-binding cassette domain-containing protein [Bacteroidota bacterium]